MKMREERMSCARLPAISDAGTDLARATRLFGKFRSARLSVWPIVASMALLALGACAVPFMPSPEPEPFFLEELPPQVAALAAPYQDLQAVRLRPEDGCYWYRHVGPVETTLLPLRTAEGRPICTQGAPAGSGGSEPLAAVRDAQ